MEPILLQPLTETSPIKSNNAETIEPIEIAEIIDIKNFASQSPFNAYVVAAEIELSKVNWNP